jgi:hypothetical protein
MPNGTKGSPWADNDMLNRLWLPANVGIWLLVTIDVFAFFAITGSADLVSSALLSAGITLFIVAIPSRVALNLIVR